MPNQKLKELWEKIKAETLSRTSPHQIALGIGVGSFIGIFPIEGFKTALVILISSLYKKVNIISIFAASNVFSFIPMVPFVYFLDYWVGTKILGIPVIFTVNSFKHLSMKMLSSSIGALFLGGAVVGITIGVVAYFVSFYIIKLKRSRQGVGLNI